MGCYQGAISMKREDIINELTDGLRDTMRLRKLLAALVYEMTPRDDLTDDDLEDNGPKMDGKLLDASLAGVLCSRGAFALSELTEAGSHVGVLITRLQEAQAMSPAEALRDALAHMAAQSNPAGEQ
jgi:hypothetical protein